MVCRSCAEAGDIVLPADPVLRGSTLARQRFLHRQCKGGTWCDCAHRLADIMHDHGDGGPAPTQAPGG